MSETFGIVGPGILGVWWEHVGSGMPPRDGEDRETHMKRVLEKFVEECIEGSRDFGILRLDSGIGSDLRVINAHRSAAWVLSKELAKLDPPRADFFLKRSAPVVEMTFDPTADPRTREVWGHDQARTVGLLWAPGHLIGDGFWDACLVAGRNIARWQESPDPKFVGFQACFRGMSLETHFPNNDVMTAAEDMMPFFRGERPLPEWVHRPKSAES